MLQTYQEVQHPCRRFYDPVATKHTPKEHQVAVSSSLASPPLSKLGKLENPPLSKLGKLESLPASKLGKLESLPVSKLGKLESLPLSKLGKVDCLGIILGASSLTCARRPSTKTGSWL